jgi:hypothetical protein
MTNQAYTSLSGITKNLVDVFVYADGLAIWLQTQN